MDLDPKCVFVQRERNLDVHHPVINLVASLARNRGVTFTEIHNYAEWKYRTALKEKEIAEKQLLLNRQHQQINSKNLVIVGVSIGCVLLLLLLVFISRSYQQKQAIQKQGTEISVWKATLQGEEKAGQGTA
ncbi:hypothetical protein [Pedobacter sp. GR22-10]|uniref:hypothetical protein n=1 Tax=Pedobacter sp. GR22-10 TaxID=2994472 RepID=UPI00224572B6|nr:hypothetical protein [Pedobacter sp. GR22-10]MCX2430392.1 hypothetical protein [Pedobacter sp. GR22-10]